ncbi:WhiB family transcriptional regulator [Streptomyces sp. NPDC029216]|uniref:WhiB family transcriptional regulator n=1 Tax=Streptomyces sp. NPDC029216 TaxID=3154701 RepID=UPI0033EC7AB6
MTDLSRTNVLPQPWHGGPLDLPCHTTARDVFVRNTSEHAAAAREREEAAKAACHACPARLPCRRHALAERVAHGVRGGLTPDERRFLLADIPSAADVA